MAKSFHNGFQIDDLKAAATALAAHVAGLNVEVDWTGEVEGTMQGSMPTVWFRIEYGNQPVEGTHPAATVASNLADDLAVRLGAIAAQHAGHLDAIRTCPLQ
jgi:hypothetical protein